MGENFPANMDKAQQLRLRRTLLGYTGYLIYVIPLAYIQYFGWSDWGLQGLLWIVLIATVLNAVFMGLILSGLNQHFADPSMTLLQITAAISVALGLIYYTPQARGVLLFLFMTSIFFGVFRLRMREFVGLVIFSGAGYFVILRLEFANQPFDRAYQLEVLRFITLMAVLLWFSVLGGYVAKLRNRLREKNSELEHALETITAIARQDELTQTFNRRHMLLLLARECGRVERYGGDFSLCILDIDHFKRVNDTYGHRAGDSVLRELVILIERTIRSPDMLARGTKPVETFGRYGGEEFILLLPATDCDGTLICVERLRQIVADAHFLVDKNAGNELALQITISAGVAQYREKDTVDNIIRRADEMLYQAKNAGRNCIKADCVK